MLLQPSSKSQMRMPTLHEHVKTTTSLRWPLVACHIVGVTWCPSVHDKSASCNGLKSSRMAARTTLLDDENVGGIF